MIATMSLGVILTSALVFGFAYLVLIFANKETGVLKTTGQVIAILIVLSYVILLIIGLSDGHGRWGHGMMKGVCPGGMGDGSGMMDKSNMQQMMHEHMKQPMMPERSR